MQTGRPPRTKRSSGYEHQEETKPPQKLLRRNNGRRSTVSTNTNNTESESLNTNATIIIATKPTAAITVLDLVLGEWLSSTTVTTLLQPKIYVTSMCFPTNNSTSGPHLDADFSVRVEAFGSGDIIVPRLPVRADTTSVGDLFDCVRRQMNNGDDDDDGDGDKELPDCFQLFFGEQELLSHDRRVLLANVIVGSDLKPETTVVVNAVVVTPEQVEARRELFADSFRYDYVRTPK